MSVSAAVRSAAGAWLALAAGLMAMAVTGSGADPASIDWQPGLAFEEPWRAFSAVALHYSRVHLMANLAGAVLVAALGVVARVPARMVAAWVAAWPLTQFGLLLKPSLLHFGGLSGVLHAGVAVAAAHLLLNGRRGQRVIGAALSAGLVMKLLSETPWGPALRPLAGWGIAVAPFAHATGVAAGFGCALAAQAVALGFYARRAGR